MRYFENLQLQKLGLAPRTTGAKPKKPLRKVSVKKAAEMKEQKASGSDNGLDKFFNEQRKKMSGQCGCGCGQPSQKKDDVYFRFCICHIFPKAIFKSIATHPSNWVERTFWIGHHTNFDNMGMDLWPMYEDWETIKEKFHELAPLLTEEERKNKFYSNLEKLVYGNR